MGIRMIGAWILTRAWRKGEAAEGADPGNARSSTLRTFKQVQAGTGRGQWLQRLGEMRVWEWRWEGSGAGWRRRGAS